jgi:hypothetical protein
MLGYYLVVPAMLSRNFRDIHPVWDVIWNCSVYYPLLVRYPELF